jgi:hypothetical protein
MRLLWVGLSLERPAFIGRQRAEHSRQEKDV